MNERTGRTGANKPGLLTLTIKDKSALYLAYMPFVKNGGLFIPTNSNYRLGDEVFMLLNLMGEDEKLPVAGRVIWLTPKGAQGKRTAGIGVQFSDQDRGQTQKKIETYLYDTAFNFGTATRATADEHVDRALQTVGLSLKEIRGRYPNELSGGQMQRTAIARALTTNPSLLVADEPVSMLDASLRMSIVNSFRHLKEQNGVSVIYITHDLATAYYAADRIAVMFHGRLSAPLAAGDASREKLGLLMGGSSLEPREAAHAVGA